MTKQTSSQENRFHGAMLAVYRAAKEETGYNATRFLQMVQKRGGLATAQYLLNGKPKDVSDGFVHLALNERLDLTVESLVLQEEWRSLFTDQQLRTAYARLKPSDT